MKTLKDILEASLLGDIKDTMQIGDTLVANIEMDFNKLRKMVTDKAAWKLHNRKGFNFHNQWANNGIECPHLMKYLGYEKLNCIRINIDRDVLNKKWFVRFFGFNNRFGKISDNVSTNTQLPGDSKLPDVLRFIDNKTKDMDTLKKFLEDNKR